jgi:hypothetical protein
MKMSILKFVAFASVAVSLNACAMAAGGNSFAYGSLFESYESPGAIGSGELGTKTGEACVSSILGIVATGEGSVSQAAKAGGITKVSHVDHTNFGVLGIYAKTCTVVHGS